MMNICSIERKRSQLKNKKNLNCYTVIPFVISIMMWQSIEKRSETDMTNSNKDDGSFHNAIYRCLTRKSHNESSLLFVFTIYENNMRMRFVLGKLFELQATAYRLHIIVEKILSVIIRLNKYTIYEVSYDDHFPQKHQNSAFLKQILLSTQYR